MGLTYRRSNGGDIWRVKKLVYNIFGDRECFGIFEGIDTGKYLLALNENEVIGMTGINPSTKYNGCEVEYTCILPNYEGRGIISKMLQLELDRLGDSEDIYCSCWAWYDEEINLSYIMKKLGFKCVQEGIVRYNSTHCQFCKDCCNRYSEGCYCKEDLYLREGKRG